MNKKYSSGTNKTKLLNNKEFDNLNNFFMQAPMAIGILMGPNHVYAFSNDLTNKILKVDNPIGKSIKELFPDNKEIIKLLDQTYKTGKPFNVSEYPINIEIDRQGSQTIYVNATYQPLHDEKSKVIGIMTTGVDVTGQVLARLQLKESEERFRTLADSSPMLMWVNGLEGCEFVNNAYLEYLGVQTNDVRNYDWAQFIHPDDRKSYLESYLKAFNTRKVFEAQFRFRRADDIFRWMKSIGVPRFDSSGKFLGFVGSTVDISDIKETEEDLRKARDEAELQKRLYEAVTASTPDLIYVFDLNKRFTYANDALLKMWGKRSLSDAKGKGLREQGYEEWHATMHEQEIDEIIRTKKSIRGEVAFPHATLGRRVYDYIFVPVINSKGIIESVAGITRDITEIRKLVQQKDEFLGIASHELKTPVTSLKAFGQVIQSRLAKAGDKDSVLLLEKMDAQINKLTNLIQDLLDISKIEGGRLQFHNLNFAFDELVVEIIEEIQRTTKRHRLIKEGVTGKKMYGDRERIGQVITNFLTNAIKYSPHEEKIIIKTSLNKEEVQVCVQDFGVGIPDDNVSKVFERFYRVKGKTHDTVPGMGLGLYIASEIIKRQGGKIWAESKKGKGSTFCFALPLKGAKKLQQKNVLVKEEMKRG